MVSETVKTLMTHGIETLRDMQDDIQVMYDKIHNGEFLVHSLDDVQRMENEIAEAVGRLAFPEDYDDMKYLNIFKQGENLYQKVRWGGTLDLISWDGELKVTVEVKDLYGVKFMGIKRATDKDYRGHFAKSPTEIENYLGQFQEV